MFFFILLTTKLFSQDCNLKLNGTVSEINTNHLKENVYIIIEETGQTAITNNEGEFEFIKICAGDYHIKTSYLGFEPSSQFISIQSDNFIELKIKHFADQLNETVIHGKELKSLQKTNTITNDEIAENSNKSFGELLSKIQGVSSLKNGNTISKPIIQGLKGNRVGFVNDGIPLASQQWGNDHGPEIDPFTADHISVIKGAAILEHLSSSANALVLVEPLEIEKEPHLHGAINSIYDTNSRANTTNLKLQNYNKFVGFSLAGTYKKSGDARTPDHFLTNTGAEQTNITVLLEKEIKKFKIKAHYSYFQTKLGVLAGTFTEREEDLNNAINRDVPFRTNDFFSTDINPPSQEVFHQLFKVEGTYKKSAISEFNFKYAFQKNEREEFDNRIGGRSVIPELDLEKTTQFFKGLYKTKFTGNDIFKIGSDYQQTSNFNIFGTATFPLVPNYESNEYGFFSTYINKKEKWSYEVGARLTFSDYDVATAIDVVERFQYEYVNQSFAAGLHYEFSHSLESTLNIGYTKRGALTDELFSYGKHQGVAFFEVGSYFSTDEFLEDEKNLKGTWSVDYHIGEKLYIENQAYVNPIQDYIFLVPNGEVKESINRGVSRIASYTQVDALLLGNDLRLVYKPTTPLSFILKFAYLRAQDTTNDQPLAFSSPNNGSLETNYVLNDSEFFKNTKFNLEVNHTTRQDRFVLLQEIIAPPDAYTLLNLGASTQLNMGDQKLDVGIKINNLTNERYRNFLNRLRYFADEQGINFSFRLGYKF